MVMVGRQGDSLKAVPPGRVDLGGGTALRLSPIKAWPLLLAFLLACGGASGTAVDPGTADVPSDVTAVDPGPDSSPVDPGDRDPGADVGAADEVPSDVPALDLPSDPPAELPMADLPADPSPEAAPDDAPVDLPTDVPPPEDVAQDLPSADVPAQEWTSLFDPARIRDPATADCRFTNPHTALKDGVLLDVWNVSYLSWESVDGHLRPIRIRGFAARPQGASGVLPGVVQAHGLGGMSEETHATGTAALLGMFVLAYTGPGGGDVVDNTSEGLSAGDRSGYRLFDTLADPRGSWFWGHAVAGLRGLTCLAARPDVDPNRMGMTGFSAGGVVTLIDAAVDDRIKAAVPLSACGAWDVAVQSPKAWQLTLLEEAGLTTASPEWTTLLANLDSARLLTATTAEILMVNGSADEFFPLTAHVATFDAIPGDAKRTAIAGNFDHGCYQVTSVEDKDNVELRATASAKGGQRMWFRHAFGTDADYSYVPLAPINLTFNQLVPGAWVAGVVVDGGGAHLKVAEVRLWASTDAKLWFSLQLESKGNGLYGTKGTEFLPNDPTTVPYYVDVTYSTKDLILPEIFAISTRPTLPAGFVPDIRGITSCW